MTDSKKQKGVFLLEVILAISIFSIAVVGLAIALDGAIGTAVIEDKYLSLRQEMLNRMADIKKSPIKEGKKRQGDNENGTVFVQEVKLLELKNQKGLLLRDLYELSIVARVEESGQIREEKAQVYVYQPKRV